MTLKLLTSDDAGKLVERLEKHNDFKKYKDLGKRIKGYYEKGNHEDRRWVKTQRMLRTLENVALEANLPKVADCKVLERYNQLVAAENETF